MEKKGILSILNWFDRGLLVVAVLALFFVGRTIIGNFFLEQLTEDNILNYGKADSLGAISSYNNDARYKPANSFNWSKANATQKIFQADSIFVGTKSKADILLNNKDQMSIGENSLVVFNKIQQLDMPNLKLGNFTLNVNGTVKIAVQGEVIEIKGHQTKIQIFIDKNKNIKAIIKTLSGQATVQYRKETRSLSQNEVLPVIVTSRTISSVENELPTQPTLPTIDLPQEAKITLSPEPPRTPAPKNEWSENYVYQWKLYDLYSLNGQQLIKKSAAPTLIRLQYKMQWKNFPEMQQKTYVLVSNNKDFAQNFKLVEIEKPEFNLREAYVGKNYWRISYDQQNWSITHELNVIAQPREENPKLTLLENNLPIFKSPIFAEIKISSTENIKGHVLEVSPANTFPTERTQVIWNKSDLAKIQISKPGILYVRARDVFMNDELSNFGNPVRIDTFRKRVTPAEPPLVMPLAKHLPKKDLLFSQKIDTPAPLLTQDRELSSETAQLLSPIAQPEEHLNENINGSQFQFEVSSFTAASSDQKLTGETPATGFDAGFNYAGWFNQHGVRANFKTKVADGSGSSFGSLTQMGLLYMRRLFANASIGRAQISGLAGYEVYRNSGSTLYSPKYDLVKIGATLMYPFAHRWGASGDAILGYGMDQSKRYELSGRVQYYFSRRWFLGLGYRLYLFEAGSESASPANLPYHETQEESYSLFGYHF